MEEKTEIAQVVGAVGNDTQKHFSKFKQFKHHGTTNPFVFSLMFTCAGMSNKRTRPSKSPLGHFPLLCNLPLTSQW